MISEDLLERVLKVREVAQHLECDPDTVYKMIREGRLRYINVGRHMRVPKSALDAFIDGK